MSKVQALELACSRWLVLQSQRLKHLTKKQTRRSGHLGSGGSGDADRHLAEAISALEQSSAAVYTGDREQAGGWLDLALERFLYLRESRALRGFLRYYAEILKISQEDARKAALMWLWFEMVHSWRKPRDEGVRKVADASMFQLTEWISTAVLVFVGLAAPLMNWAGEYFLIPVLCFLISLAVSVGAGMLRAVWAGALCIALFSVASMLWVFSMGQGYGQWLVLSWGSGVAVGIMVAAHLRYLQLRKRCAALGVFGCIWVRHLGGALYEVALTDGANQLVWRHRVRGWFHHFDGVLGVQQSFTLRSYVRSLGMASPGGGWVQCYPSLISTRMVGGQRWNPADWDEARSSTEGISGPMVVWFADRVPLPGGPAGYQGRPENSALWRGSLWEPAA